MISFYGSKIVKMQGGLKFLKSDIYENGMELVSI